MNMHRLLLASCVALLPGLALAQSDGNAPPPPPAGDYGPGPGMMGGSGMMGGPGMMGDDSHGGWGTGRHGMGPEQLLLDFYSANTTHDGHLTLAQAQKAGLKPVVEHFGDIDVKKHGYVTFYDIEAWRLDDLAKHLEQRADELRGED